MTSGGDWLNVAYLALLLGLVGSGLIVHVFARPGPALRNAALWVMILAGLALAYSFRHEARQLSDRVMAELRPERGAPGADRIAFVAGADGHFSVEARVDGVPVLFLVDTGASDVTLSPADARRLGFDPDSLVFSRQYLSANGVARAAPVRLGMVEVGPIRVTDVEAAVNQAEMDRSLLGMSFLRRIGGYEVRGERLTLYR